MEHWCKQIITTGSTDHHLEPWEEKKRLGLAKSRNSEEGPLGAGMQISEEEAQVVLAPQKR